MTKQKVELPGRGILIMEGRIDPAVLPYEGAMRFGVLFPERGKNSW